MVFNDETIPTYVSNPARSAAVGINHKSSICSVSKREFFASTGAFSNDAFAPKKKA